jgi:hypothetical protein
VALFAALDAAGIAVLVTAIGGAILGLLGFLRGAKADTTAAQVGERTVAREEFDSVVAAQRMLLAELRIDIAKCETEKTQQADQIAELRVVEQEQGRQISALTSRVQELERTL